jgi:hypothetical protein
MGRYKIRGALIGVRLSLEDDPKFRAASISAGYDHPAKYLKMLAEESLRSVSKLDLLEELPSVLWPGNVEKLCEISKRGNGDAFNAELCRFLDEYLALSDEGNE